MKKLMKKNTGITLIALIITIIVMLILAGITINMVIGENGVITQAQNAKTKSITGSVKDAIQISKGSFDIVKAQGKANSLIEYWDTEGIIKDSNENEYLIDPEKLLGTSHELGKGTLESKKDIYLLKLEDTNYELYYYDSEGNISEKLASFKKSASEEPLQNKTDLERLQEFLTGRTEKEVLTGIFLSYSGIDRTKLIQLYDGESNDDYDYFIYNNNIYRVDYLESNASTKTYINNIVLIPHETRSDSGVIQVIDEETSYEFQCFYLKDEDIILPSYGLYDEEEQINLTSDEETFEVTSYVFYGNNCYAIESTRTFSYVDFTFDLSYITHTVHPISYTKGVTNVLSKFELLITEDEKWGIIQLPPLTLEEKNYYTPHSSIGNGTTWYDTSGNIAGIYRSINCDDTIDIPNDDELKQILNINDFNSVDYELIPAPNDVTPEEHLARAKIENGVFSSRNGTYKIIIAIKENNKILSFIYVDVWGIPD